MFKSSIPDPVSQKYDRQLRMWQSHGQAALERAHVCVVNATSVGTEFLKNLVLPNIAAFTIIDPSPVKHEDLGNNFFVSESDLGQSRAKSVARHLKDLNHNVEAHCIEEDVAVLREANPQFILKYSLIVVTGRIPLDALLALDFDCFRFAVPLMVVKSCGFVATLRTVLRAHHIVERKPEYVRLDLRLTKPWPQLLEFVDSFRPFDHMSSRELGHVPFPVILLRLFPQWRAANPDSPTSEFKAFVISETNRHIHRFQKSRNTDSDPDGTGSSSNITELINWNEAYSHAYLSYHSPTLDSTFLSTVLSNPILTLSQTTESSTNSPSIQTAILLPYCRSSAPSSAEGTSSWPPAFWAIAAGLKSFVDAQGIVPLAGTLPDMHADSNAYIQLQHIYRDQALRETMDVRSRIRPVPVPVVSGVETLPSSSSVSSLSAIGSATSSPQLESINSPSISIPENRFAINPSHSRALRIQPAVTTVTINNESIDIDTISMVCRNASHLTVVATKSLSHEYKVPHPEWVRQLTGEYPGTELAIYILFRAVDLFQATHRRWPGDHVGDYDTDVAQLRMAVRDVLRVLVHGEEATDGGTPLPASTINLDDWVQEFVRAGPAELHTVSAFIGGVAAQEAIKIITSQFLPIAGTYVYNGIDTTSAILS